MPTAEVIIWAAISSLIIFMLGIIGYLLNTGFASLKAELAKIWDKLDQDHTATVTVVKELAEHKAACAVRHKLDRAA